MGGLATLVDAVGEAGVKRFGFSSSPAVYGSPGVYVIVDLVTEDTSLRPISPYGATKLAEEWPVRPAVRDRGSGTAGRAHGIATVCLRHIPGHEGRLADGGQRSCPCQL